MSENTTPYPPVGALWFGGYWRAVDRVLSHNADGTVTVIGVDHPAQSAQWNGDAWRLRERTHMTPFDPKHDRVL
jgi:hypothetical protein